MNKYEKLIEYIVNDEQDKAKALFHEIVVEKSRDIYESLMDDEHEMGGNPVGHMVDEISTDETGMHEEDDEMSDLGGDMGGDDEGGDDEFGNTEMGGGEEEIEDRVQDLEDALDELKAEFESLMADEMNEPEHNDGVDDPDFSGVEGGDDDEEESYDGEEEMNEAKEEDDEEDDEEETTESRRYKSEAEKLREYVDKVSNGHGVEKKGGAEGQEIGTGGSVSVNKQGIVAGKNDMGGTAKNLAQGYKNGDPDGKTPANKTSGLLKQGGDLIGNVENRPGGNAGKTAFKKKEPGHGSEKKGAGEGKAVGSDGSVPVNKSSILKRLK